MRRDCKFCGWKTLVYPPNISKCSGCGKFYNEFEVHSRDYKVVYKLCKVESGCRSLEGVSRYLISESVCQICKKDNGEKYCFHKV